MIELFVIFDFVLDTPARKNPSKLGFALAYSYLYIAIPSHYFPFIRTEHYCLRQIYSAFSLRRVTTFFECEMKISYISIYSESKNMESIQVNRIVRLAGINK